MTRAPRLCFHPCHYVRRQLLFDQLCGNVVGLTLFRLQLDGLLPVRDFARTPEQGGNVCRCQLAVLPHQIHLEAAASPEPADRAVLPLPRQHRQQLDFILGSQWFWQRLSEAPAWQRSRDQPRRRAGRGKRCDGVRRCFPAAARLPPPAAKNMKLILAGKFHVRRTPALLHCDVLQQNHCDSRIFCLHVIVSSR